METLSKLSTLEKRELHIPSGVITQAQAGTLLDDELAYYDNITSNQELDNLEAMVDYDEVLIAASEDGAVGVHILPSTLVGRKSTGGIVALTSTDLGDLLPEAVIKALFDNIVCIDNEVVCDHDMPVYL